MDEAKRAAWLRVGSRILGASPERFTQVLQGLEELALILEAIRALDWRLVFRADAGPEDRV